MVASGASSPLCFCVCVCVTDVDSLTCPRDLVGRGDVNPPQISDFLAFWGQLVPPLVHVWGGGSVCVSACEASSASSPASSVSSSSSSLLLVFAEVSSRFHYHTKATPTCADDCSLFGGGLTKTR